jgi:coenzyme PQQ synthesis protein D (PqqD)
MNPPLPARVTISPAVLCEELDGEAVLLNLDDDRFYGLDDVATRMWKLLAPGDVAAALSTLLEEYSGEVNGAALRADLADLIGALAAAGLLTVDEAG